jgi:hypothetical protein
LRGDVPHHLERHYPLIVALMGSCARPKPSRCLRSPYTASLCRLSPVPAGRWPFPTLSPRVLPQVPGPLPRWDPMVHLPVPSHRTSAFPRLQEGRLPHLIRTATSVRDFLRGCSHSLMFRRPGLLTTQVAPTAVRRLGSRDFYFRAPHGSLPPRVPDILAVRIGQLTAGDFHPIRLAALSAAPVI